MYSKYACMLTREGSHITLCTKSAPAAEGKRPPGPLLTLAAAFMDHKAAYTNHKAAACVPQAGSPTPSQGCCLLSSHLLHKPLTRLLPALLTLAAQSPYKASGCAPHRSHSHRRHPRLKKAAPTAHSTCLRHTPYLPAQHM